MILDTTSKTIELILASAKTTNDCEYTADWVETINGTTFAPGGSMGTTNGTTAVTPVSAPASSSQRHVKALTVYNADTVNSVVTVRMYDGTNRRIIMKVTLTPGQTLCFTPEAGWAIMQSTVGQIPGTTTNDNAAAGCVGEFISSSVLIGSAISMTSGSQVPVTTISLTAGDWDVKGVAYWNGGATTTVTELIGIINSANTTPARADVNSERTALIFAGSTPFATDAVGMALGPCRISLSATTTIYLLQNQIFGTSTCTGFGKLTARRAR